MKDPKEHYIYRLEKLIDGKVVGKDGWYAAVPDRGYKGHPFKIQHLISRIDENGEYHYNLIELEVKDWNKAEAFRKMPQTLPGLSGFYTLGYFKIKDYDTV